MAKIVKKSPWPIYAVGAVWLVFGLFLPFYQLTHFALAAALSAAAWFVAKKLCPDKVILIPDPAPKPEPKTTGSPELDALILERDRAIAEIRRLNANIADPKLSAQMDHMEEVTEKIVSYVVDHPEKRTQIRKFLNYYLPTTLKLLNAYDRMDDAGITGTNIDGTMGKIETMMDAVVQAFDRQLDALFADEALDISTDITVLENMLAREGLGGLQMKPEGS